MKKSSKTMATAAIVSLVSGTAVTKPAQWSMVIGEGEVEPLLLINDHRQNKQDDLTYWNYGR